MEQLYLYMPLAAVLALLLFYRHLNRSRVGSVGFIIATYLGMSMLAAVLEYAGKHDGVLDVAFVPMLYLSVCLVVVFWGFMPFRDYKFRGILIEDRHLYRRFETFIIVYSLSAIVFFVPFSISALSGDIAHNRLDLAALTASLAGFGFVNTLFSLSGNMFAIPLVMAFIDLASRRDRVPRIGQRTWLLFVSSLSTVFYVLAYVGRDGVILWVLTFVFLYLLFSDLLHKRAARLLKRGVVVVVLLISIPFFMVSTARFEWSEVGVYWSMLQYGGSQVRNFNDQFLAFTTPQYGQICFDQLRRMYFLIFYGADVRFNRLEWFPVYTDQGVMPWTFSTFIGTFVQDFGYFVTPVLLLVLAVTARLSLRNVAKRGIISFPQLLVYLLCVQIVLYGVFYFRQMLSNLYLLALVFVAFWLSLSRSQHQYIGKPTRVGGVLLVERPGLGNSDAAAQNGGSREKV